jgi:hypothetical protein
LADEASGAGVVNTANSWYAPAVVDPGIATGTTYVDCVCAAMVPMRASVRLVDVVVLNDVLAESLRSRVAESDETALAFLKSTVAVVVVPAVTVEGDTVMLSTLRSKDAGV